MASKRRRRLEHRGRPRQAKARRRETTRAGRSSAPDKGTPQLRHRKRQATGGREDLEATPIATLFGYGLIDATQHDTLARIGEGLRRLAQSLGPKTDSVTGLWQALTGAATSAQGRVPDAVRPGADHARHVVARLTRKLNGSYTLVMELAANRAPSLVMHALEGRLTAADHGDLALLRSNLDRVAGRGR